LIDLAYIASLDEGKIFTGKTVGLETMCVVTLMSGIGLSDGAVLSLDRFARFSYAEAEFAVDVGVSCLHGGIDVDGVIRRVVDAECGVAIDGAELKRESGFARCVMTTGGALCVNRIPGSAAPPSNGESKAN
jgi:hypothetical protein